MEVYDGSVVEQIELRMIRPSSSPVRYPDSKDSPELAGLKSSIREHGLLSPILVRPLERGFEIVAGHRRFSACRSLRWRFIPCKIRELADRQAYEIQLSENLQRKTMDPIEEAEAFQRYVADFGWGGVSDLGRRIGKSEEYVSHRMQLLRLPDGVREKVTSSDLSPSQALELATMGHVRPELVDNIVRNKLTIRQIRRMKDQLKTAEGGSGQPRSRESSIVRKSNLTLKITLSRIDDLIYDAHKAGPQEKARLVTFLMELRRQTHSMIDDTLKYRRERLRKD